MSFGILHSSAIKEDHVFYNMILEYPEGYSYDYIMSFSIPNENELFIDLFLLFPAGTDYNLIKPDDRPNLYIPLNPNHPQHDELVNINGLIEAGDFYSVDMIDSEGYEFRDIPDGWGIVPVQYHYLYTYAIRYDPDTAFLADFMAWLYRQGIYISYPQYTKITGLSYATYSAKVIEPSRQLAQQIIETVNSGQNIDDLLNKSSQENQAILAGAIEQLIQTIEHDPENYPGLEHMASFLTNDFYRYYVMVLIAEDRYNNQPNDDNLNNLILRHIEFKAINVSDMMYLINKYLQSNFVYSDLVEFKLQLDKIIYQRIKSLEYVPSTVAITLMEGRDLYSSISIYKILEL